jgi:hypothetical protein
MSPPELDERFDELVLELRATQVGAPPELRERVRTLLAADRQPPAPRRRRLPVGRLTLAAAPLAAALAVGATFVAGLFSASAPERSAGRETILAQHAASLRAATTGDLRAKEPARAAPESAVGSAATLAPTLGRAQQYEADLHLWVRNLSRAAKRALALTRSLGGYVRSVDYAEGSSAGGADLVVRVPVGAVQTAIVRFSALGAIVSQHVDIQDVQPRIDARFRRLQALRLEIAKLQATPLDAAGAQKLARLRRQLRALQREQAQAIRRTSFATIALSLTTRKARAAPPAAPSRIDRALDRAGGILLDEAVVVVYMLVVGGPIAVLAALVLGGGRALRRRGDTRLLERS